MTAPRTPSEPRAPAGPITALTSGVGLGVYVPALLNQRDLRAAGYAADTEVIEGWYTESQLAQHLAHRDAFQKSFDLALLANRMPRSAERGLDFSRIDALLARWAEEQRSQFIVWSGYWFPVLERYAARVPHLTLEVDLCRIDAAVSASFRVQRPLRSARCREIWLWNGAERRLEWHTPVAPEAPLAWETRASRLVVHGGGWAIGTYEQITPALRSAGYALDLLAPRTSLGAPRDASERHFVQDADWHPWLRGPDGELRFPPLAELDRSGEARWLPDDHYPPSHTLVRQARAVVSKPGGGTLIDALASATPVVLLEPYGEAEARSGELWEELGFGIRFERWQALDFDPGVLERLHRNLLEAAPARSLPRYPRDAWTGGFT